MAKSEKFPKTLYVTWEQDPDGDEMFLIPFETVEATAIIGKVRQTAIYELKEVVGVSTKIEFSRK